MTVASTTATSAVQAMIFAALDGNLSAPVLDYVPDGTGYPYVTIGDAFELREDVHGRGGRDLSLPIHVWSRYRGMSEAQGIVAEIDALLDNQQDALSASGWNVVRVYNESTRLLRQPDVGEGTATRHAIAQYRVIVQEA